MIKNIFILFLTFHIYISSAQKVAWIDTLKAGPSNFISSLETNVLPDLYVVGGFGPGYTGSPKDSRTAIFKYSSSGKLLWQELNISATSYRSNLVRDKDGNFYFSAWLEDGWGIIPTISGTVVTTGTYLIKFNVNGKVIWFSQKFEQHALPGLIWINSQGNIEVRSYGGGTTSYSHVFDTGGNLILTDINPKILYGKYDKFGNGYQQYGDDIRKYDPNGNQLWSVPINNGYTTFIIDADGNSYLTERGPFFTCKVEKLNPVGQLLWTKNISTENGFVLATDNSNLYLAGCYGSVNTSSGVVVKKLDVENGAEIWSTKIAGDDMESTSITTANGAVYFGARYFDGVTHSYLIKITDESWTPTDIRSITKEGEKISVYPNPSSGIFSLDYTPPFNGSLTLNVLDPTGKQILSKNVPSDSEKKEILDLIGYPKGTYLLHIIDSSNKITIQKLVLK